LLSRVVVHAQAMSHSGWSSEEREGGEGGSQRTRVLALLRAFGWNATSFQILEAGLRYWFEPAGCVAYVDTGRAWVAAGAPLAPEQHMARVAGGFVRAAGAQAKSGVFFAAEQRFVEQTD
jgi:lysylphosphatidylglycerol synthetase-like protein (DUF2156 family)